MRYLIIILSSLFFFACGGTSKEVAKTDTDKKKEQEISEKLDTILKIEKPKNLVSYFEGDLDSALQVAKLQNKNIFIFFTAAWCAPCHRMDHETFSVEEVYSRMNSGFINVRIDAEDFDGYSLVQKYNVKAYPTFVMLSPKGKEEFRFSGFKFQRLLLEMLEGY